MGFTDFEDYTLKMMKNSEYYSKIVKIKSKEMVEEREGFLNID